MRISRKLNFTGRERIKREEVSIEILNKDKTPPEFSAEFKLSSRIPAEACLYVEAYRGDSTQRFDFGTVGAPIQMPHAIDSIDLSGTVLFRVKVVDPSSGVGLLLASVEGLRAEGTDDGVNRMSLMHIKSTDLRQLTWRLDFSEDHVPELFLNNRIPCAVEYLNDDPVFQGLILPSALREVLMHIYLECEGEEPDEDSWNRRWLDFCEVLSGNAPDLLELTQYRIWVENVVDGFCDNHRIADSMINRIRDER